MIKLISQFDTHQTKLSLATPTCGGCCCCCCSCIGTTIAYSIISSRMALSKNNTPTHKKILKKKFEAGFTYLALAIFAGAILGGFILNPDGIGDIIIITPFLLVTSLIWFCIENKMSFDTGIKLFLIFTGLFGLEFLLWLVFNLS